MKSTHCTIEWFATLLSEEEKHNEREITGSSILMCKFVLCRSLYFNVNYLFK